MLMASISESYASVDILADSDGTASHSASQSQPGLASHQDSMGVSARHLFSVLGVV